jgi:hypothetical protein
LDFEVDEQYIGAFSDLNTFSIAQLFSDPNPAFSSISVSLTANPNSVVWMAEGPNDPTIIGQLFIVHSDAPGPGDPDAVPEPSTFLLVGAGLAGIGLLRKRFKK